MWIQMNIPRIEDGNNFGVSIQVSMLKYSITNIQVYGYFWSYFVLEFMADKPGFNLYQLTKLFCSIYICYYYLYWVYFCYYHS